eukprot:CAMPEP_0177651690 /NCGR_PEP_ID=MMETSP0447-20121125/12697_1 /TAXON_ID=0 /ORGANISM="Stygamoeba regulata, Strain BSH-02190019" /LENGTH=305 /DNA_ID=CAMNT_0019154817 /DNA_START=51 /DNA_END=968 /DNA_ORIENTATION=-
MDVCMLMQHNRPRQKDSKGESTLSALLSSPLGSAASRDYAPLSLLQGAVQHSLAQQHGLAQQLSLHTQNFLTQRSVQNSITPARPLHASTQQGLHQVAQQLDAAPSQCSRCGGPPETCTLCNSLPAAVSVVGFIIFCETPVRAVRASGSFFASLRSFCRITGHRYRRYRKQIESTLSRGKDYWLDSDLNLPRGCKDSPEGVWVQLSHCEELVHDLLTKKVGRKNCSEETLRIAAEISSDIIRSFCNYCVGGTGLTQKMPLIDSGDKAQLAALLLTLHAKHRGFLPLWGDFYREMERMPLALTAAA